MTNDKTTIAACLSRDILNSVQDITLVSDSNTNADSRLNNFLAEVERRAFVMARTATRDGNEALDLVQDAMLAFVSGYQKKDENAWKPLFYRILQNRIYDWHRRQKVRNRWRVWLHGHPDEQESGDAIQMAPDPNGRTPEEDKLASEASEKLILALQELPIRQQQAFLMRIWEGLDVAETASAMGCSDGSVKTHLSRAMHKLRTQLEEHRA